MVAPSGNSQSFQVIIDLLIKGDKASVAQAKEAAAAIKGVTKEQIQTTKELEAAEAKRTKEFVRNNQLEIREIRARANVLRQEAAALKSTAGDIDKFARPLAAGGALVVGGIFAAASKYVNDAKEATATTIKWKKAQDDLNKSGERIGEVLATTALPILEDAAKVAAKLASYLEANPEVAGAALNAGLIALTVGTLGKAVSSGIRLYADLKLDQAMALNLSAAQLQLQASQNQLKAAGIQAGASGGATPAKGIGGAVAGALSNPAVGVAAIAGVNILIAKQLDKLETTLNAKKQGVGTAFTALIDIISKSAPGLQLVAPFRGLEKAIQRDVPLLTELAQKLGLVSDKAEEASQSISTPSFLGGSKETQDQLLKAYETYKEADLALVKQHYEERQGIISSALASTSAADSALGNRLSEIARSIQAAEDQLLRDFNTQNLRAEQDYLDQRREIAESAGEDILRIEEDSQDRLSKLREQFEDRAATATRARDALALRDARRDFNRSSAEEIASTNKEIARRRQDVALRLRELDVQFARERERRLQDYQERLIELEQQEEEQNAQAHAAHAAEINRIQEEQREKLKQLDANFNAERTRRYQGFVAQINDLNQYLLGTYRTQVQYHAVMLREFQTWIQSMRASIPSASSTSTPPPIHDFTGYAYPGLYRMANNGQREFVLSGNDTRALEQRVGGQLSQSNFMQSLNGGQRNVNLSYNPRFDGTYTAEMRRQVQKDAEAVWDRILS